MSERPTIELVAANASEVTDASWEFERQAPGRVVRFLRGAKMRDASGVLDQFAAALQFPYYFGQNWAALSECIEDLSWLPATSYLIVVLDAELVLRDAEEELPVLAKILREACTNWPHGFDLQESWARQPASFRILLQCEKDQAAEADNRWSRWLQPR